MNELIFAAAGYLATVEYSAEDAISAIEHYLEVCP